MTHFRTGPLSHRLTSRNAPGPTMHTDIRCPSCRSIDWWPDGFIIVEDDAGELIAQRAAPAVGDRSTWSCASCAYEVPAWTRLAGLLDGLRPGLAASA